MAQAGLEIDFFSLLDALPVRVLYRYRRWNVDPRVLISCAGCVSLRCIDTMFYFLFYFIFFCMYP